VVDQIEVKGGKTYVPALRLRGLMTTRAIYVASGRKNPLYIDKKNLNIGLTIMTDLKMIDREASAGRKRFPRFFGGVNSGVWSGPTANHTGCGPKGKLVCRLILFCRVLKDQASSGG